MADALNQAGTYAAARICTLKYRKPDLPLESGEGEVILLGVKRGVKLDRYTRRNFRQLVAARDLKFVEELFDDMIMRAKEYPDELFEQMTNLSVGPIVTDTVQSIEKTDTSIRTLFDHFFEPQSTETKKNSDRPRRGTAPE